MLRVVIFIVVAKFNYTTFTPRYFYSVIRQINLNQSEHDLAWFKNACANVSEVHMTKQLWGFNTLLPQSCLLS